MDTLVFFAKAFVVYAIIFFFYALIRRAVRDIRRKKPISNTLFYAEFPPPNPQSGDTWRLGMDTYFYSNGRWNFAEPPATPLERRAILLRRVWTDKGNHPAHHDMLKSELQRQWPLLYTAIETLIKEIK